MKTTIEDIGSLKVIDIVDRKRHPDDIIISILIEEDRKSVKIWVNEKAFKEIKFEKV